MPYSHHIQIISALVFLLVWSLDSFIFKFSVGLASFVPWVIRLIGALCVIILGIMLARLAEKALFQEELEAPTVIDTGILGHVRHPLYLGVLLIYLGFIIGTFSIISFVIFIFVALIYNKLATYEEQDLERIFGEKYLDYKCKVPKWIPRLSSAKIEINDRPTKELDWLDVLENACLKNPVAGTALFGQRGYECSRFQV